MVPITLVHAAVMSTLIASGALAQERSGLDDARQLPAYHGRLRLFTLTSRGDIDGLVLTDGMEIKTAPRLSTEIASILRPGDDVTIHGLKAAQLPLIQAFAVINDRDGKSVVDKGVGAALANATGDPPEHRAVTGQIRMLLHGPRGEVDGILLQDDTILKLPPADAERFSASLRPGREIAAEGATRITVAGTVVEVTAIGSSADRLQPVQ